MDGPLAGRAATGGLVIITHFHFLRDGDTEHRYRNDTDRRLWYDPLPNNRQARRRHEREAGHRPRGDA